MHCYLVCVCVCVSATRGACTELRACMPAPSVVHENESKPIPEDALEPSLVRGPRSHTHTHS